VGAPVFALLYGVPTWGFAMIWLALAAAITVRTARRGLPFALTWWSFTFPVGTLLVAAWLVVAARTVAGSATGRLFKPI
jgi:tellurite resistance protein TehA-like permease